MELIAHRGASGYAPENTIPSFEAARKMGMKNFEFDVQLTRDGILVVHHDYDLSRTAGSKVKITGLTFEELKKFNVAAHFKPDYPPQAAPGLEDVMGIVGDSLGFVCIDVRNDGGIYKGIEDLLLRFLHSRKDWFEKATVSSFDYPTLHRIRALDSKIRLGLLSRRFLMSDILKKAKKIRAAAININHRLASGGRIRAVHEAGMKAFVYTVNSGLQARKLAEIGADGIYTNYPDVLTADME